MSVAGAGITDTIVPSAAVPRVGDGAASVRPTRVRHVVLWLTVLAYLITYMDRVVIATAAPSIQKEFGFSLVTMGWIFASFQFAYAFFQIPGGWLGDRFGPRRALTGVVLWWSTFTAATALTFSAGSMMVCRFLFGMGEAGAFPIATRSLSRWMLPAERGWAQGLTHAGARLGGAVTPVFVALLIVDFGWRMPFLLFAVVGIAWALLWFWYYRDTPRTHRSVNAAECAMIEDALGSGPARAKVPWRRLLANPQLWLLSAMYFCYAYCINIFLTWFPKYLHDTRGFDIAVMGLFASMPLMAGVLGDLAGGWTSDLLVKRGAGLKLARRVIAVIGFLTAAAMIPLAAALDAPIPSIACFCVALFGLELTVGVSWAVTLDIGGEFAGSVSAVMNTLGNLGAAIAAAVTGYIVTMSGWFPAFMVLAVLCLIAAILFLWIDASRRLYVPEEVVAA
ncbi:MFS transporter [Microvirga sp. SRT01]|uniref:MFS transporter n=1 Tax=Sphingomonas longa TaxID=2778730 RepID=A0ABS2D8I9_9SPHN|nr:MFS transporter [Microvirga sp. SRT01]MBM6577260.1 MFS transporter [Sphingomonas sp. BT552]MBR7710304.1 MFS transporter [Microvirga sp. SRT01]